MARSSLPSVPAAVEYPSSDGQPIAETDHQRTPLAYAVDALRCHFCDRADVYVSGNLFIYYPDSPSGRRPPIYRAWRCASIMQGRALKGGCHAH